MNRGDGGLVWRAGVAGIERGVDECGVCGVRGCVVCQIMREVSGRCVTAIMLRIRRRQRGDGGDGTAAATEE